VSDIAAFFQAVQSGDASRVEALLDADSSLANAKNEKGQSPVLMAVYTGRKEIRDLLLARGIELQLHEAAAAGHLAKVNELVEKDPALAKSYSPDGFPVFALAAVFGHHVVAEYLFSRGADVNAAATNGTGYNALTGAVASGHAAIVKWLLEHGAAADYRYGPGHSPLLEAAANGHLEIVKMLLEYGADVHAKTNDGKSVLNIAQERGHSNIAEFLGSRGAA
jgi:ankyrin repeat protein